MGKPIRQTLRSIKEQLTDDKTRISVQFIIIYFIFAFVSMFMTIMNIVTGFKALMWSTLIFSVANMFNICLALFKNKAEYAARVLFSIEAIALCTFFVLNGEPEGFACNWCCLLCVGGMILYKRKFGSIIAGLMFLILIFFFWIPWGKDILINIQTAIYEGTDKASQITSNGTVYTSSYMLRFPVFYVSSFAVGLFFETLRSYIQEELTVAKEKYRRLSFVDSMTGLSNENSYQFTVSQIVKDIRNNTAEFAVIVLDVNNLKRTNDTLGHLFGNHLIIATANELVEIFAGSKVFHIGGDEFVVLLQNEKALHTEELFNKLREKLNYSTTFYEGRSMILSVACGVKVYEEGMTYDEVFTAADAMMYENKQEIKEKYKLSR